MPFTGQLFMGKHGITMLCQSIMYLLAGIVVGTVNGWQLNEWEANGAIDRGLWQLIAIFDKINQFLAKDLTNGKNKPATKIKFKR